MPAVRAREGTFRAGETEVSFLELAPPRTTGLYVLAHGAGADMRHCFMEQIAEALAEQGVATFRYQFPYAERGRKRPDAPRIARATVRAAVQAARSNAPPAVPVVAGGKSFGGRMTSQAQAEEPLEGVRGLAFLGFPLHAAGKRESKRAAHLAQIDVPMLFLQGTRDALASLDSLRPVVNALGARAQLRTVEGADHSFGVLVRSGRTRAQVIRELASAIREFCTALAEPPP